MKVTMPPRALLLSAGLLFLGLLLTFAPQLFLPASPPPSPPLSSRRPTPTWGHLPTRIPTATPSPTLDLAGTPVQTMREALAQQDYIAAQAAWNAAHQMAPQNPMVAREGARLALARDQLHFAQSRIWRALNADAHDAASWVLLGATYARRGEYLEAEQAWSVAQSLDPALAPALFLDRWYAARQAYTAGQGAAALSALAQTYSRTAPEDPLAIYYQSAALLAVGDATSVIPPLISVLGSDPNAPAVLWYTLGEAYLAGHAYSETITVLEVAGSRFAQGDTSLYLASNDPIYDLNLRLAYAYLGRSEPLACANAEPLLRRLTQRLPELTPMIAQAIACQTPTPTWTPWLPSQRIEVTPTIP